MSRDSGDSLCFLTSLVADIDDGWWWTWRISRAPELIMLVAAVVLLGPDFDDSRELNSITQRPYHHTNVEVEFGRG